MTVAGKIHKVAVVSADVERSVEFYTKKLGLEAVERFPNEGDDDFVFLKSGGATLELMPKKTIGTPEGIHHVSFEVADVDGACEELRAGGAKILAEPFDAGVAGIRIAFLEGPDGERLQLFHRG